MDETDVAVVGAGPAGVAVAVSLRDQGVRPLLIDKADVAASWWLTTIGMPGKTVSS